MADRSYAPTGIISAIINGIRTSAIYTKFLGFMAILIVFFDYIKRYLSNAHRNYVDQLPIEQYVISFTFTILFILVVYREFKTARKERYANSQIYMHDVMHKIRDMQSRIISLRSKQSRSKGRRKLTESEIGSLYTDLQSCLDCISEIFSNLTGDYCRVSIKQMFEGSDGEIYLMTLARDARSAAVNFEKDRKREDGLEDALKDNTDFDLIFNSKTRWFFSNNLRKKRGYINSHDKELIERAENLTWYHELMPRKLIWKLGYISTVIWPIKQSRNGQLADHDTGLIGFLTVDSVHRNVFDEKFDVYVGAACADALYHVILGLRELQDLTEAVKTPMVANKGSD